MKAKSERELRSVAERTSELGGTPIRTFASAGSFLVVLLMGIVAIVAAMITTQLALAYAIAIPMIAFFVLFYFRALGAVRLNNDGVAALLRGDDALATEKFRALVSYRSTRENAAMGLHNLGVIALRAGRPKSAIDVFRAALAVQSNALRLRRASDAVSALVHAHLGFALAATGDLDGAEHELSLVSTNDAPTHLPMAMAYETRARAFTALRRDRPAEAVAALDGERALLANVLTGNESMLVEALLAVALAKLGGVYEGTPRPPSTVFVDADAARFIFAYLPEAKEHLAEDEAR
jgi:tetratricopeptide (TPR) repeat protein